ncbi:hypothetical protein [Hymenobacter sp. BT559]|uniref:hypothetical protein n=1 Tax=Hymenobacter sp. BT559 TaxID=2795729 RepID=UPI0018EDF08A|nr:hypothetical protein [Hymenobacter sp. BT559]MBJ6142364.1 hypothetical protein [Hymenobacter sp. BT559]
MRIIGLNVGVVPRGKYYRLNLFVGAIWHDWQAHRQRVRGRRAAAVASPATPAQMVNP